MGAHWPAALKGAFAERVFRRLARGSSAVELDSNLGLDERLKWRVPAANALLAFGLPAEDLSERATLDLSRSLAPHADGFLDVGANYGIFAAAVRLEMQGREFPVVCVEADPELAARLARNCESNALDVEVLACAASNGRGRAKFLRNLSDDSSGSLTTHFAGQHVTREIEVDTVPLSDVLDRIGLERALVKIDVEGAGVLAWEGLSVAIPRIRFVVMEVIGPEATARLPERIVAETGWHSYYIEDYVLRELRWSEFRYRHPFWNWLFCKDGPATLRQILPARFRIIPAGQPEPGPPRDVPAPEVDTTTATRHCPFKH